jgi:hypothetical protein
MENNFTALLSGYVLIQGEVADESGNGIGSISIVGVNESIVTDANGKYILEVPTGWSGTIEPVSTMYRFVPDVVSFVHLTTDQFNIDFTAVVVLDTFIPEHEHAKVYPNPSKGPFMFIWTKPLSYEGVLAVTSTSGQEVYRVAVGAGARHIYIDLGAFPDGLYQCSLYCNNGLFFTYRVMIR